MEHIEIEGLRIAYERGGQGQALVLLHGFFGDTRVWRPQLEGFSDEFEVVAWIPRAAASLRIRLRDSVCPTTPGVLEASLTLSAWNGLMCSGYLSVPRLP